MLSISDHVSVYVYTEHVDMRKSINGLVVILVDTFEQNPQTGDVFVFTNRQRNKIKILYWDKNGFVIHYKRLERGRFCYSSLITDEKIVISASQLSALLMGFDFYLLSEHRTQKFQDFF